MSQTKPAPGQLEEIAPGYGGQIAPVQGRGQPLPARERAFFEPRFGHDFGRVRIHADLGAAKAAEAIGARAFALGGDLSFAENEYAPGTVAGKRLLAHELVHVVQQRGTTDRKSNSSNLQVTQNAPVMVARKPDPLWGGFDIRGTDSQVQQIRDHLNELNRTTLGKQLLDITLNDRANKWKGFVGRLSFITIEPFSSCDFTPKTSPSGGNITYNASGCVSSDKCGIGNSRWMSVPPWIYLFHEVVHSWLYNITGQGTHKERECMATGLGQYFNSIQFNENKLRCELGFDVRPCYDGQCPGMAPPTCPANVGPTGPPNSEESQEAH